MGRPFREYLDGRKIYACKFCRSHLTCAESLVSKASGPAGAARQRVRWRGRQRAGQVDGGAEIRAWMVCVRAPARRWPRLVRREGFVRRTLAPKNNLQVVLTSCPVPCGSRGLLAPQRLIQRPWHSLTASLPQALSPRGWPLAAASRSHCPAALTSATVKRFSADVSMHAHTSSTAATARPPSMPCVCCAGLP